MDLLLAHYQDVQGAVSRQAGCADLPADVMQEAFLKLVRRPPEPQTIRRPGAFLQRVANRLLIDRIRAERSRGTDRKEPLGFDLIATTQCPHRQRMRKNAHSSRPERHASGRRAVTGITEWRSRAGSSVGPVISTLFPERLPLMSRISASSFHVPEPPCRRLVPVLAVLLGLGSTPLIAADGVQPPAIEQQVAYDLPMQPLADSLQAVAAGADIDLVYPVDLVRGKQAPALQGAMAPDAALRRLLHGSGLRLERLGGGRLAIRRSEDEQDAEIGEPIVIEGDRAAAAEDYVRTTAFAVTRTATPIIDMPASIQVVPQQVLADQQVLQIGDAVENVSGVQHRKASGVASDSFTIRGFNQGGFILTDGFRTPNPFAARIFEMDNIERLEVLKGPASVLFGRIEPGGVINLVTKKPLREYHHSVEQQVGSYEFYRTAVDTTGPIPGLESLQYRLIASYEDAGSFRDHVENE
ncbi:MAG: TonB-dependent receptor plug domain-containing protein, partial [Planctomycetota bacterium]